MAVDPNLQRIARIAISLQAGGVTKAGFGQALCLAPLVWFTDRTAAFASVAEMALSGCPTTAPEYQAGGKYFSQNPSPDQIIIGRRDVSNLLVYVDTVLAGATYTITLDGTACSYTSIYADLNEILTGLKNAIDTSVPIAGDFTATVLSAGLLISRTGSAAFTCTVDSKMSYTTYAYELTVTVAAAGTYTITINGTTYSYAAGPGDTTVDIATGLEAAIIAGSSPIDGDRTGSTLIIFALPGVASFDISVTPTASFTGPTLVSIIESVTDALTACRADSNDWYGLGQVNRNKVEIREAATYAESDFVLHGAAKNEAIAIDTTPAADEVLADPSIPQRWKSDSLFRSWFEYLSDAHGGILDTDGNVENDDWPEFAWLGTELAVDLDTFKSSRTWAYDTLTGVTVDNLTQQQINNLTGTWNLNTGGKNGNVYVVIGGQNKTVTGKVGAGEWIQTIIGRDWLYARLTEAVANVIFEKPYFDDDDIISLVNAVRAVFKRGQIKYGGNGFIAFDSELNEVFGVQINFKKRSEFTAAERATRNYTGITFVATLSGGIHVVTITGQIGA